MNTSFLAHQHSDLIWGGLSVSFAVFFLLGLLFVNVARDPITANFGMTLLLVSFVGVIISVAAWLT